MAKDGTTITTKTTGGSYSVTDKLGMWHAVKEILPEEKMAEAAKFSMVTLREKVAEHMHVPISGKSANSATQIVERKTAPFVTQGTRSLFVYR